MHISTLNSKSPMDLLKEGKFPPEKEEGNIEYKRQLCNLSDLRYIQLASQMKWRLMEGDGIAYYMIGVNDKGDIYGLTNEIMNESISNLYKISDVISATLEEVQIMKFERGNIAQVIIKIN